ncbi:MAG: hypothetical protein VW579_12495 [Verrucomicrobiales bacterium]
MLDPFAVTLNILITSTCLPLLPQMRYSEGSSNGSDVDIIKKAKSKLKTCLQVEKNEICALSIKKQGNLGEREVFSPASDYRLRITL